VLILKRYPTLGKGSRELSDPRGQQDGIVLRIPPSEIETVVLVTVHEYKGHAVDIGVEAPRSVLVMREEAEDAALVQAWREKKNGGA
jgi:hypothetical protein